MWRRIALIGFSGTGKTTTARILAKETGWRVIDLDEDIERRFGTSIPQVFASQGEQVFRRAEREALENACRQDQVVIATGGGASAEASAWTTDLLGNPETLTVTLDASPEVSLKRLREQQLSEGDTVRRPMIEGEDPLSRITSLKARRQEVYDRSLLTLQVDRVKPKQIATEIASLLRSDVELDAPTVTLDAPGGQSRIYVQPGIIRKAGTIIRESFPNARRVWIVTDANVAEHHAAPLENALRQAGLAVATVVAPPGESSKSIAGISGIYDQLLGGGIERNDVVIALGGGVIGDLAGFAAATVLRGVRLVQIPTSLLAMVDSSVGGKTGINHPAGKNLIGSFYQPPIVLIDPEVLHTLPSREFRQGWAEVIKHAVIQPSTPGGERADLSDLLERNAASLQNLREPAISYLIGRNVALKSRVVEADERESGIRAYLNFGHTLGHAIEASDYSLLHGEAIALGLRAAGRISVLFNDVPERDVNRLNALLDSFGLPRDAAIEPDRALQLLQSDKKRVAGEQRWILMKSAGGVEIKTGVPADVVRAALDAVIPPVEATGSARR